MKARPFRNQTLLRLPLIGIDLLLVNAAFLLSYWMRYIWGIGGEVSEQNFVELRAYFSIQVTLTAIFLVTYLLAGLYREGRGQSYLDEVVTLLGASSLAMMLTLALVFLYQGFAYSRWLFFFTWALSVLFLAGARALKHATKAYLRRRGVGVKRVLVVGGGELGRMVMHVISTEPGLGYQLAGYLFEDTALPGGRFIPLGRVEEIPRVVQEHAIEEVFIALPASYHRTIPRIMEHCQRQGVSFRIVPELFELSLSGVDVDELRGIPVIGIKRVSIAGFNLVLKRAFDLVVSALGLVAFSWLFLLIAVLIRLDSPGPVFFKQTRLGRNRVPFAAYKFRSMHQTAEAEVAQLAPFNQAAWPLFKMRDDPRITRVGSLLRRTSLDELPQLFNVLRGEMSLVGPRPPLPEEVERYETWHGRRLEVQPGITGLWQVSGRSDLPFDEMVMLDIYYIENWSFGLDLRILLRTLPAVLSGKGAY